MKNLVASFNDDRPARLLRDRFEQAGIAAKLKDDFLLQRCIFFVKPAATKKVYVDINEFDRARGLLRDWDRKEHVLDGAVHCPECNSPRIEYPQYTRKFVTPLRDRMAHQLWRGKGLLLHGLPLHLAQGN